MSGLREIKTANRFQALEEEEDNANETLTNHQPAPTTHNVTPTTHNVKEAFTNHQSAEPAALRSGPTPTTHMTGIDLIEAARTQVTQGEARKERRRK